MKVFIKGVKIQTPIDQNTYRQLSSEPYVALTRINEAMCSYSRYRRQRHDSDDIYGPNFEDEESYYRFQNEQNNYQNGFSYCDNNRNNHQSEYLNFNDENGSYRNQFGVSGEFTRSGRPRRQIPPNHRYTPYQYSGTLYRPPYRERQRGGRPPIFSIPTRPPPKKWRSPLLPTPTCDEVSSKPSVQNAKVNSSDSAIVKKSLCSDTPCSQDKPPQKVTSAPTVNSCETVPKGDSSCQPTEKTAVSDVKTENNTTVDLETVCFEAPAVEDTVDFLDHDVVVVTCTTTTVKEDMRPMATSTPTYEIVEISSDDSITEISDEPEKLSVSDFVIDEKASFLPTTSPDESMKEGEEHPTLKNKCKIVDFPEKTSRINGNSNKNTLESEKLSVSDFIINEKASFLPKITPNEPKKCDKQSTMLKGKCDTNKMVDVVEKTARVNDNNKRKLCDQKSTSEKVEKRKITGESNLMKLKLPRLDVSSTNTSSTRCTKEIKVNKIVFKNNKFQESKDISSKKDETRSKKSNEVSGLKNIKTGDHQAKKRVEKEPVRSSGNKIQILENIRFNSGNGSKPSSSKQDHTSHQEKRLSGPEKQIVKQPEHIEKNDRHHNNKPSNKKSDSLPKNGSNDKQKYSAKAKHPNNDKDYNCELKKVPSLEDGNKDKSSKLGEKQKQSNESNKKPKDPVNGEKQNRSNESNKKPKDPVNCEKQNRSNESNKKPKDPVIGENQNQSYESNKKPKVPVIGEKQNQSNSNKKPKDPVIGENQNQSNELNKKPKDPEIDEEQKQSSESNEKPTDLAIVKEPSPAKPIKQQEKSPVMSTSTENNNRESSKTAPYRRKSVDMGVLGHRNELSTMMRRRRAMSVSQVTDAGDYFTGFRLTRSKSQELGATLVTDVVNFGREHKKLNLQNTKSVSSRRSSECAHEQNPAAVKRRFSNDSSSNSFKLIDVIGSLAKDPRLNRNTNPQFLTKEKFMESLTQSGTSGLKDYRFNFEKNESQKFDKINYVCVNSKPTSLLISPMHDHLSFLIGSNSRTTASGDDKKPQIEALKNTSVSPFPVMYDKKGNSELKNVYINPSSPPSVTKVPQTKNCRPQPYKTKKISINLLPKGKGSEIAKKEPLSQTFPSKTKSDYKFYKPVTFTTNNPIAKRKRKRRKNKNNVSDVPQTFQNVKNAAIHPVLPKFKPNKSKDFALIDRPMKKPVPFRPNRNIQSPKSVNVPATTSTILKDCLLNEDIDKYFPSNSVKSSSMVLNVGGVSILMTEKGCKRVSHESVETLGDIQWQKVDEFLIPKQSEAKTSVFKGATEEIDHDMTLHEVIESGEIVRVMQSLPTPTVITGNCVTPPKPSGAIQNSSRSDSVIVTSIPITTAVVAENSCSLNGTSVTPIPQKTAVITQNDFGFYNTTVTPISQQTPVIAQNGVGSNSMTITPILQKTSAITENCLSFNGITVTPIPANTSVVAENKTEKRSIPVQYQPPKSAIVPENPTEKQPNHGPASTRSSGIVENCENITEKQIPTGSNPNPPKSTGVALKKNEKLPESVRTPESSYVPSVPISELTPIVTSFDAKSTTEKRIVPVPASSGPTGVLENIGERTTSLPTLPKPTVGAENTTEKRTVLPPLPSKPTTGAENASGIRTPVASVTIPPTAAAVGAENNLHAVVSQIGSNASNQPPINFSVTLQPPVRRVSHRDLANCLVPFIYRLLIYKNEKNTFKTVREKMNRNIVSTETVTADWKILSDAYFYTFLCVGNEMLRYLKGVDVKTFQLGLLLKDVENFFANNGFSSVTQPMVLFVLFDVYTICKPISGNGFLDKLWNDVKYYATYLMKRKAQQQSSSNVPPQEHVPSTTNRQQSTLNHQINNSNSVTTNNTVAHPSVPNYSQMNNGLRPLPSIPHNQGPGSNGPIPMSSISHNSNQGIPNNVQSGGYIIHHYPSANQGSQFNVQNPQIGDITTYNSKNSTKSNNNNKKVPAQNKKNNKKQMPNLQQHNQISNQSPHSPSNYGYFHTSNPFSGQGQRQERQNPQQSAILPPYPSSIPSTPMGYNSPYHNQPVTYNTTYQQNAPLQNVASHIRYDNFSNYQHQPRQNVVNNYNNNSSSQAQQHVPLGRRVDCSLYPSQNNVSSHSYHPQTNVPPHSYPRQNTVPPPSYYHNTVYPATLPQIQHSSYSANPSMQNVVNNVQNNYTHPENTFPSQQNEIRRKDNNKSLDNAQNLPIIQSPATQTLYPVLKTLFTQNVPAAPSQTTNSIQIPPRPQYLLKDLLRSHQFPPPTERTDISLDKQNVPDVSRRNDINDKEVSVEQSNQTTSSPITTGSNPSEIDATSKSPPVAANSTDNFKIYLPPRSSANTINEQTQPESPVSSEVVPISLHAANTSSNDYNTNPVVPETEEIVKICDSDEEEGVEPEFISFEKWVSMNQEVIDLEDYADMFEAKYFKQDIKNEVNNDTCVEEITVEEFPPEASSPDSGICTPRGDELNICFCGVKAAFVCSCRSVIYCSRRCQEVDWDSHQKDCKSQ